MSISDIKRGRKIAVIFLSVSMFCILFNFIYSLYSHEVSSDYMTYMFVIPLLPVPFFMYFPKPSKLLVSMTACAVASLTTGCCLQGVFEIAGTDSPYLLIYFAVGTLLLLIGIIGQIVISVKK